MAALSQEHAGEAAGLGAPALPLGPAKRALVAGAVSAGVHALALFVVTWLGSAPRFGFEIELPREVELGLTQSMIVSGALAVAPALAPVPAAPGAGASTRRSPAAIADAGTSHGDGADAGTRRRRRRDGGLGKDAGETTPDEERLARARGPDAGNTRDAGGALARALDGSRPATDGIPSSVRLPAGAQIALRLDMARIRRSSLAPDVRALLDAIPDWHAVLDGSDMHPVDDLDRLLLASPNLERSRMVLAGRYEGDENRVREAVARMAEARGVHALWTESAGVPVARWANADETERTIALVGPRHFVISRPEDLPRMLAIASARAAREASDLGSATAAPPEGPEALLAMDEGVALSLEVEGARMFTRGVVANVPMRARLTLRETDAERVEVEIAGHFETAEQAQEALQFWDDTRQRYGGNPLIALAGLGVPLRAGTLDRTDALVTFRTELTENAVRLLLLQLRSALFQAAAEHSPGDTNAGPAR